ncbi:pteridine reductase [Pontibacterium granulatum]|uniref:pteridine reductase n=1 Tax=Pontibacterium granulatum TaxID=2036029 RepID=UPI00249B5CD5|nr:pteridine reductase [Pontibacterium granulatum]MDI3322833.1 pteridine reductase [Pontibacterium granulatum]
MPQSNSPTALITGSARRIGAEIARRIHSQGYSVIIHCRHSRDEGEALVSSLNNLRASSAFLVQADLTDMTQVSALAEEIIADFGDIHLLVNNASSFYPTTLGASSQQQWDDLINSNLRAAYFLTQSLSPGLIRNNGAVINLVDIHSQRGLPDYPIYSIAKAGVEMMVKVLAKDLAPNVRINGVSPGPILWPEAEAALSDAAKEDIMQKTPLRRSGTPKDIADAVYFLAHAPFITGQVLAVDGGRSLFS